jgi:hypothetical protein
MNISYYQFYIELKFSIKELKIFSHSTIYSFFRIIQGVDMAGSPPRLIGKLFARHVIKETASAQLIISAE